MVAISGIYVSVVIVEYVDGSLGISARSDGTVNVQIIMEELGGGGHQTVAGVQLDNKEGCGYHAADHLFGKKTVRGD